MPRTDDVRLTPKSGTRQAADAVQALKRGGAIFVRSKGAGEEALALPAEATAALVEVLEQLARGSVVRVVSLQAEVTTQQAADLLNVSRPYLVQLLERGSIPFRKVGTRRRLRLSDLLRFKDEEDRAARKALKELSEQAQQLNLGY